MSFDIENNMLSVGDIVIMSEAANVGSKSKRLLRGKVVQMSKKNTMCQVFVFENERTYYKRAGVIAKAYSNCT